MYQNNIEEHGHPIDMLSTEYKSNKTTYKTASLSTILYKVGMFILCGLATL